jgi:hypothetical protein
LIIYSDFQTAVDSSKTSWLAHLVLLKSVDGQNHEEGNLSMLEKVGHAVGIYKPMGDWQSEHDYQKRANGFWQIVFHPLKYAPIPYQTFDRK